MVRKTFSRTRYRVSHRAAERPRSRRRVTRTASALAMMVLATGAGLAGPLQQPAAASHAYLTGLEVVNTLSGYNSLPLKTSTAVCPAGKQVLGGGGIVSGTGDTNPNVVLTRLEPYSSGGRHRYAASAATALGTPGRSWNLRAYAFCADPVPGHHIVTALTTYSSTATAQSASARCPSGQRALGSGARIHFSDGYQNDRGVALQVARASATGDITRAHAREAPGYSYPWAVAAYAVCADTPPGYEVVSSASTYPMVDGHQGAKVTCPTYTVVHNTAVRQYRKQLIGMGGAGDAALRGIFKVGGEQAATAWATQEISTDFLMVQAICAR